MRKKSLRLPLNTKYKILHTKRRLRTYIGIGILLILLPLVLLNLFKPTGSEAAWFDSNYGFRKQIPITNGSGSTQTNFQLQATIDTAALITEGKMQSDCDDIRFTSISGKVLDYWLEPNTCNTAATLVWFKADSIPTSGAQIYFYYGNASASSGSSPQNTFIKDMTGMVASWPLQDTDTTQSYAQVNNSYEDEGRNIVINGGFDSDTVWTKGTGWTISGGLANAASATGDLTQPLSYVFTGGKYYEITFTISNWSAGTIKPYLGGITNSTAVGASGTYTQTISAATAGSSLGFQIGGGTSLSLDNVSVTQVDIPSSSTVSTNLLTDGDMETSGTSSWTSMNLATLSKQATNPHSGSQVVRIARSSASSPGAGQTNLTVGNVYRAHGYARSDGSAVPNVTNGSSTMFTGSTSTSWQPFDFVFIASNSVFRIGSSTNTGSQYVEFDDVTVTLDTTIRSGELLQDGDMEASGTSVWLPGIPGVFTKETSDPHGGSQNIKVTHNGTNNNPYPYQPILVPGKKYNVSGWARGTTGVSFALLGLFDSGIALTSSWQYFDRTVVASSANFGLQVVANSAGQYGEFDDISITEVSPMASTFNLNSIYNPTMNTAANGHLSKAYSFDGSNDNVNIYSSDLNSALNPNEGTIVAWVKVSGSGVWTDGSQRFVIGLRNGVSNEIQIFKTTTNNRLEYRYIAGGTVKSSLINGLSNTGWMQLVATWSKSSDESKFFLNGAQQGSTLNGLGQWEGSIANTNSAIGSFTSTGTSTWSGLINDVRIYNRALSAEEISAQYSASSDIQAYYSENYIGHELLRKYNTSVTLGAQAGEEVGPGPVAYWNFNEGQGQTVNDSTSNNNDGTLGANSGSASDDPTWVTEDQCVSGKCLRFDGGDNLTVADNSTLDMTSAVSISFWAKQTASDRSTIISKRDASNTNYQVTIMETKQIQFCSSAVTCDLTSAAPIEYGRWYYYSIVFNGSDIKYYINGNLFATINRATTLVANNFPLYIGSTHSGDKLNGDLDEIKIYPYARTAAQVKADYNLGFSTLLGQQDQKDFLSDGLVGYWKMDQTSWNGTAGEVVDSSGNGNHGTRQADATTAGGKFGNGGTFDGTGDYINLPSLSGYNPTAATISVWAKSPAWAGSVWVVAQGGLETMIYNGGSAPRMRAKTNSGGQPQTAVQTPFLANTWYHYTVTISATEAKWYIDGNLYATLTTTSSDPFNMGGSPTFSIGSIDFNGNADEFRFYNRTLSASEVASLYNWAPGPVGYWKMDEESWNGTSGEVVDSSGNGINGTATNGAVISSGKFGNAGSFDGNNDYITASNPSIGADRDFTLSAWVNPNTIHSEQVGGIVDINGASSRLGTYTSNTWFFQGVGGQAYISSPATANQWSYVTGVYTAGGGMKLYINGVLKATGSGPTTSASSSVRIGRNDSYLNGKIDEVKIYNYARTPSQIIEDMNGGHPIGGSPISSMLAHYKFDEQTGQSAHNSGNGGTSWDGVLGASSSVSTDDPAWKTKADCKTNGCLSFDGGDYVVISTPPGLPTGSAAFTTTAWIKTDAHDNSRDIVCWGAMTSSNANCFRIGSAPSLVHYFYSNDLIVNTSNLANVWHHVAVTYDGTTRRMYLDGNQIGSNTPVGVNVSSSSVYIGSRPGLGEYWDGLLDEVKIYNTALTAEQVKLDMNSGSAVNFGATAASEATLVTDGAGNPPVAYWPMDEKQDNTCTGGTNDVCDKSGNGNDGAWNGTLGSQWTRGKTGSSGSFNGSDNYIVVPCDDSGYCDPSANNFSVEAWVKTNDSSGYIIGAVSITGSDYWRLRISSGKAVAEFNTGTASSPTLTSTNNYNDEQWHHIVGVRDGTTNAKLYVDGKLLVDQSLGGASSGIDINGEDVFVGSKTDLSDFLLGQIDDVKIYNYARTPAQIAYDYNRGAPVGHWKLDECEGTTAYDNSGNGNNGTITIGASGEDTVGNCTTSSTAWGSGATGKLNSSLSFDGVDDYISYPNNIDFGTGDFSLSTWIYLSGAVNPTYGSYIFDQRTDTDSNGQPVVTLRINTGNYVSFAVRDNVGALNDLWSGSLTVSSGQWYHIAAVKTSANLYMYINGKRISNTGNSLTGNFSTGSVNRFIGKAKVAGSDRGFFPGQIDDVRIYNYPLSATQIQKLYNENSSVRFSPNEGNP